MKARENQNEATYRTGFNRPFATIWLVALIGVGSLLNFGCASTGGAHRP